MNECSVCVRCGEISPDDDMTCDAFGDSNTMMCDSCLYEVSKGVDERFVYILGSPEIIGPSFIYSHYKEEYVKMANGYGKVKKVGGKPVYVYYE